MFIISLSYCDVNDRFFFENDYKKSIKTSLHMRIEGVYYDMKGGQYFTKGYGRFTNGSRKAYQRRKT